MKKIKLNFCDFWKGFSKTDNYFCKIISMKYQIEISENPDFLIYSVRGQEHQNYQCVKIFYTGENERPNFNECDFAFTFDYIDRPNHYRLPLYALYIEPNQLIKENHNVEQIINEKKHFCNFVYSKGCADPYRAKFFHRLSQYKRVDSGGHFLNNIGGPIGPLIGHKLDFIKQYKFTIAFENSSYPGYTTEKIVHPMLLSSLPIYWGNELISNDFNPKSFINYYDFASEDALIEKIIEIDQNEELYRQYLLEPYYHKNQVNSFIDPDNVLNQFYKIFENSI